MTKPHSATVRGTLDHPNFKNTSSNPPQLGDQVSLQREKHDAAPNASEPADPYRKNENVSSSASSDSLPHSKKVRGTLANSDGKTVNKSMLGDPASLKAETSDRMPTEEEGSGGGVGAKGGKRGSKL